MGRNKDYTVVRASSKNQADEFEELFDGAIAYARKSPHSLKVGNVMIKRVNKTGFMLTYPDRLRYSQEIKIRARYANNKVMTDALGNDILQTVYIVTDPDLKKQLMDAHERESDHGYNEQEKYQDGVTWVEFLKGQIEESVWERIERLSHPSSGKSFLEHLADKELIECIKC